MCGIPVASVEDSNRLFVFGRQVAEELDEANLIIDLGPVRLGYEPDGEDQTFNSGLEDMFTNS
jgi:hypothetical protein